jgi:tRNA (guanine-N7-)-methyltransferase
MPSSRPSPDRLRRRILHGRRQGRPLRKRQQDLLETLLPQVELGPLVTDPNGVLLPLDPAAVFPGLTSETGSAPPIWLEVGFGGGEHLIAQAQAHPDVGFIGCEPFLNGVTKLLAQIDDCAAAGVPVANIRIFKGDGRQLLEALPMASVGRAFLLFPDPWPKTRHHKRRFVQVDTLDQFARVLVDDAELRIATDHSDYCRWALSHLVRHPTFNWLAEGPADWRIRPADWPATRYEAKAEAAGRARYYLRFLRVCRAGVSD